MATGQFGGPNDDPDTQNFLTGHLTSPILNLDEESINEWDVADTAQRLIELDGEDRAHLTAEEQLEANPRLAAVWAQHGEEDLARYRALHDQINTDNNRSVNTRTRLSDSQFGSDGNQYNPYAPHTSEEYMLQEIEAGRMVSTSRSYLLHLRTRIWVARHWLL